MDNRSMVFVTLGLCVFVCLLPVSYSLPVRTDLSDPCTIKVRKPYFVNELTKDANPTCTNGTLYWGYPAGNIVIRFNSPKKGVPYLICLDIKPDAAGLKYFDVTETFPALKQEIPYPGPENLACIPDLNGTVAIQVEGPFFPRTFASVARYLTIIDWIPHTDSAAHV